jgi:hypothetical protein
MNKEIFDLWIRTLNPVPRSSRSFRLHPQEGLSLFEEGLLNVKDQVVTWSKRGREVADGLVKGMKMEGKWKVKTVYISSSNNMPILKVFLVLEGFGKEIWIEPERLSEPEWNVSREKRYFVLKGDEGMKELARELKKMGDPRKLKASLKIQSFLEGLKKNPPLVYSPLVQLLYHLGLTEISSPTDVVARMSKEGYTYLHLENKPSIDDLEGRKELLRMGYLNAEEGFFSLSPEAEKDLLEYKNLIREKWKRFKGNWKLQYFRRGQEISWEGVVLNEDKKGADSDLVEVRSDDKSVQDYFLIVGDEAYQEFAEITPIELLRDMMSTVLRFEVGSGFRKIISGLLEKKLQLMGKVKAEK